jgi:multidrug transporter EmrE-like cation transporter
MDSLKLFILILFITLLEALGQYLLNITHHKSKKNILYYGFLPIKILPWITWLLYGLCTYLLLHSYKFTTMGKAEIYWDALSAIIVPIIGIIYFSEDITILGWTGIFLIIIGTLILGCN